MPKSEPLSGIVVAQILVVVLGMTLVIVYRISEERIAGKTKPIDLATYERFARKGFVVDDDRTIHDAQPRQVFPGTMGSARAWQA